jgi:uncharacterized protein (DUF697 family)
VDLHQAAQIDRADLFILVMDAAETQSLEHKELVQKWAHKNQQVIVLIDHEETGDAVISQAWSSFGRRRVLVGNLQDSKFLHKSLPHAAMDLLPDQLMALGRHYPFFRVPVAQRLVNETSITNGTYSLSTGLAEVVPVLGIPVFITDMIILTKNQAYLVFKMGMALGLSTRWQDYVAEFGGVLGAGFVWRQIARSLVGLIPAWGIVPKVAIAYSGTYVVGNTVLYWYLNGRHVTPRQMQEFSRHAFARGKEVARSLIRRAPRPQISRPKTGKRSSARGKQTCPNCGKVSARDAQFCQYCGFSFHEKQAEQIQA